MYPYLKISPIKKKLFIFVYDFWLCWVFVAVRGLSLVAASGGYSSFAAGFSLQWLLLLRSTGSRAHRLQEMQRMGSVVVAREL